MQTRQSSGSRHDFIRRHGPAYLAHLLRRMSDELVRAADVWYPEVGVTAPPRTTSTLLALDEHGPLGVTELAALLRQSHPLVITWIRQLQAARFVTTRADKTDRRRNVVALTARGRAETGRLRRALATMGEAAQALLDDAAPGLFEALWQVEGACRRESFVDRLRAIHAGAAGTSPPRRRRK